MITPLRIRCKRDDGTARHYAVDLRLPTPIGSDRLLGMISKISFCLCGAEMVALIGEEPKHPVAAKGER